MTGRVGQYFGNYQLVKWLGQGGCAQVYLGKHRYLNSYAALKVLNARIHPSDEHQFLDEAQRLVDLRHANIVHLLDFCIEDGTAALIMDYAPKGSLRQQYPEGTQMPLTTVVDYVAQIVTALQYAHNHNVIHRDVKPANILLDTDNRLLLSDFGLSLFTPPSQELSTQNPAGTPRYMAPEQLRGKPCFASDQYALAVMIYEWLCGQPPFRGNVWEIWQQHLYTAPPPLGSTCPELPPMLERVVRRALAKEPQDRFVSIQAFGWALARASQTSVTPGDENASQVTAPMRSIARSLAVAPSSPAAAPLQNKQGEQMPTRMQVKDSPKPSPASALQQQNRQRLLQRVRSFWITGVLEQSLHGAALMALGLQEQPDAVANPWRLIMQESELASTPLPAGTRITEVYDQTGGELLLLGEPGAGKTTLLLELARDLLKRAEQERTHLIPVIFNLSSWTRKQQPLAIWLIEELETKYKVPRKVGSDWIVANQILPLLDGLDEVDAPTRSACMQAINDYHQAHSLVPLVVCCRIHEYRDQANKLSLSRAVTIQPLSPEQITAYFVPMGERLASLQSALQHDPVLQELATTPLMLTILILVYQDASLEEIKGGVSAEVRQQQIFATYTQRMLQRRSARFPYSSQQTIHWLSFLAQQMKQQSQTVFYLERMQPTWLMKKWQRRLYSGLIAGSISGLLAGLYALYAPSLALLTALIVTLVIGLPFGWLSEPETEKKGTKTITRTWMYIRQSLATALESRVKIGIITGLIAAISSVLYLYLVDYPNDPFVSRIAGALSYGLYDGIYMGLPLGLAIRPDKRIEPMEALSWSWTRIRRNIVKWLLISIGTGLILGLIFALRFLASGQGLWLGLANFLSNGFELAFYLVLVIMLVNGVVRGLSKRVLNAQYIVTPNQGTWRSAHYGVVMAIIIGGIVTVCIGATNFLSNFWLPLHMGITMPPIDTNYTIVSMMSHLLGLYPTPRPDQEFWALDALFVGLNGGAILGLAAGLYCGGAAYVQHFVLRFLLWSARSVPFNYPRFLDYAASRILLRKVGGGYIFIHRLLLEHFASLEEKPDPSKPDA
jgi:serine/threonine protein kinase/DNA polymerase III delta prime subunit